MSAPDPQTARPAGVLRPWQRRLYGILLVPLGLIAANSIYLAAFTRDTSFFYAMLLLHVTLGLLIAIPFFVFALTHAKRMIRMWNRRAKAAGLAIVILAAVCVSTGLFMTVRGATLNNRAVWLAHVSAVPLADSQQRALERALARQGASVELSTEVDPSLVGGLVVRAFGRTYDGSVRQQLAALRRRLAAS